MDDTPLEVIFHDSDGKAVGKMASERDGKWQRIPVPIALKLLRFTPESTPEMVMSGHVIGLFRTTNGLAELWAGTASDAWAKASETLSPEDALGARFTVEVDAYVLKADGTIER